jgi:hypothetical protein
VNVLKGMGASSKMGLFQNGKGIELGFGEDFMGFGRGCSSILGIVELWTGRDEWLLRLMCRDLAKEFQFGT